jgi:cytochrome c oxidase subunit 4
MLRTSILRAASSRTSSPLLSSTKSASLQAAILRTSQQPVLCLYAGSQQTRRAHAISNPTLANIEKRWEEMPPQEQADLWMALRDRMKTNWHELTLAEKKAGKLSLALFIFFAYPRIPSLHQSIPSRGYGATVESRALRIS